VVDDESFLASAVDEPHAYRHGLRLDLYAEKVIVLLDYVKDGVQHPQL